MLRSAAMTETRLWDRAASVAAVDGRRRPAVVALPPGLPTVAELFDFMRDAESRFATLRMRIDERRATAAGEQVTRVEILIRHPGDAKVLTSDPELTQDLAKSIERPSNEGSSGNSTH